MISPPTAVSKWRTCDDKSFPQRHCRRLFRNLRRASPIVFRLSQLHAPSECHPRYQFNTDSLRLMQFVGKTLGGKQGPRSIAALGLTSLFQCASVVVATQLPIFGCGSWRNRTANLLSCALRMGEKLPVRLLHLLSPSPPRTQQSEIAASFAPRGFCALPFCCPFWAQSGAFQRISHPRRQTKKKALTR